MGMPAEAFRLCDPGALAPGALFRTRDLWAMKTRSNAGDGFLVVARGQIGAWEQIEGARSSTALTLAPGWGWRIRVPRADMHHREHAPTRSVVWTASGPGFWDMRHGGQLCYGLDGTPAQANYRNDPAWDTYRGILVWEARPEVEVAELFAVAPPDAA